MQWNTTICRGWCQVMTWQRCTATLDWPPSLQVQRTARCTGCQLLNNSRRWRTLPPLRPCHFPFFFPKFCHSLPLSIQWKDKTKEKANNCGDLFFFSPRKVTTCRSAMFGYGSHWGKLNFSHFRFIFGKNKRKRVANGSVHWHINELCALHAKPFQRCRSIGRKSGTCLERCNLLIKRAESSNNFQHFFWRVRPKQSDWWALTKPLWMFSWHQAKDCASESLVCIFQFDRGQTRLRWPMDQISSFLCGH